MAEPADINVDELRRRARRRLVGAVVLALGVAVVVPMLLETEQKPLGEDVSVKIPPIDDSRFVNRLSENRAKEAAKAPARSPPPAKDEAPKESPAIASAPTTAERASKYDTRLPAAAGGPAAGAADGAAAGRQSPAVTSAGTAPASPAAEAAGAAAPVEIKPLPPVIASVPKAAPPETKSAPQGSNVTSVPKAAPAAHDGFAVQLAAFADDKGANALAGRLKKAGYTAYTEPLKTSKGTLWRVRVGPYPSREAAVAARDKLKTEGQSGIVAAVK